MVVEIVLNKKLIKAGKHIRGTTQKTSLKLEVAKVLIQDEQTLQRLYLLLGEISGLFTWFNSQACELMIKLQMSNRGYEFSGRVMVSNESMGELIKDRLDTIRKKVETLPNSLNGTYKATITYKQNIGEYILKAD